MDDVKSENVSLGKKFRTRIGGQDVLAREAALECRLGVPFGVGKSSHRVPGTCQTNVEGN